MERLIEAQRTMCYGIEEFLLNTPESILAQMPSFENLFTQFRATLNLMPNQSESQTMDRKGQAILKEVYKRNMVVLATDISARVKAYAVVTNNVVLAKEMSKSYSTILKTADTVSADLCMFIHGKATDLLSELTAYGVTQDMINKLDEKVILFVGQLFKPRAGIVERKKATKKIKLLMTSLLADLRTMDVLVDILRFSQVDFYDTYNSTRRVIDTGRRSLSIVGLVLTEEGLPLEKADVSIVDTEITRKTSQFGGFEIKNLRNDVYKLRFTKPGYLDVEMEVPVTATMRSEITVKMARDVQQELKVA